MYRLSTKDKFVLRINLMLTELGYIQHYSYVKSISALLYDQTQHNESKHYCLLCLTGFSKKEILEEHEKHCNGLNGRPTKIEMPKETDSRFRQQLWKKCKAVNFQINKRVTRKKTNHHAACGYAFIVVRSDGLATKIVCRRGETQSRSF